MFFLDLFKVPLPGWFSRESGLKFVEICAVAFDAAVEAAFQIRLSMLGTEPLIDSIPYTERDRGIVYGVYETPPLYQLRIQNWLWSARNSGKIGIAHIVVDQSEWTGQLPRFYFGEPTPEGVVILVDSPGTVGTDSISFDYSTDGGVTFPGSATIPDTSATLTIGALSINWNVGDVLNDGDILSFAHGGAGQVLTDIDTQRVRGKDVPAPVKPGGMLHELAGVLGPSWPKIRIACANGDWWTRETDGTVWRLRGGPWAWNATLDADPAYWARSIIIIYTDDIEQWELPSTGMHNVGEIDATFGNTGTTDYWNRIATTIRNHRGAHALIEGLILALDPDTFDPTDSGSLLPDGNWWAYHMYDMDQNAVYSMPETGFLLSASNIGG